MAAQYRNIINSCLGWFGTSRNELQQEPEKFSVTTASLISDRSRELARKTGVLRHTPAVGLDAAVTTKILQWFFRWSSFLLCSIYAVALRDTHAYKLIAK